jgi:methyl-accepting chemotaxis protein
VGDDEWRLIVFDGPMDLPLPRGLWPTNLLRGTVRAATTVASVPDRVLNLLTMAESVVARADELMRRTERTIAGAEDAVAHARKVTGSAEEQLATVQPLMRFAEEFSTHEVHAAIKLVDELPRLSRHLNDDILPILGTLSRVGPDIHELLAVANDVRQAILGIPGFDYLRRRGEEKDGDTDKD